jgi:acyl-CoA thioester hydrolase
MPLTHVRTYRVRYYECDAYGRMHHANYLRYMQETAFDASATAGYDLARYEAIGRHWLVRETDIEYLLPLHYGDSVQVKTWVADFRRVRSCRVYEFRLLESEELAARAHTDWAYLDSASGRPVRIPPEMIVAFFPNSPPEADWTRSRFPTPPSPPPGAFRLRRRVEQRDIDAAGHVNNAAYLAYLEDWEVQLAARLGWPPARLQAEGFTILARRHQIEYRQPALLDDQLEVVTWLSDAKGSTAVRHYTLTRTGDGALLARARAQLEWVSLETWQPVPIPASFLEPRPY